MVFFSKMPLQDTNLNTWGNRIIMKLKQTFTVTKKHLRKAFISKRDGVFPYTRNCLIAKVTGMSTGFNRCYNEEGIAYILDRKGISLRKLFDLVVDQNTEITEINLAMAKIAKRLPVKITLTKE
jgi:hypothetical protein